MLYVYKLCEVIYAQLAAELNLSHQLDLFSLLTDEAQSDFFSKYLFEARTVLEGLYTETVQICQ